MAEQGRAVPRDELAEALWGDDPPATWDKALSVLVSKLRALLAEHGIDGVSALTGAFGCYRLELPEGSWVDVVAAAGAAQEAEHAVASGDLDRAREAGVLAASLVREPFLPAEDGSWVEEKRRELTEVRLRALDVLVDACLRSGEAREAAKWAEQAVAMEPFRESGYRRLMEAHIAAGNRAEALRVYERCRRLLADELGTYPSPETESTYRALLETPAHSDVSASPAPPEGLQPEPTPARRSPSRKRVGVAAVLVALAAGLAAGIVATRGGASHTPVAANSIVALKQSGSIAATVPVGARPVAIASGAGSLWVANFDDESVTRVDPATRQAVRTIPIGSAPTGLAPTSGAVWVADGAGDVSKIDPGYNQLTGSSRLAAAVSGFYGASAPRPMLSAFGSIWVVDPDGYVSRIDPGSLRRIASVDVGTYPSAVAAGASSVWVTNGPDGTVTRIDPTTLLTTTIPVGHGPTAVAVNAVGAWIANSGDDTVVRVDTDTNAVASTTRVGDGPAAILATPDALWVANAGDGTVMRLDPRSGNVKKTIRVGGTPDALASAGGRVWVAVAPAPPPQPETGGIARVTLGEDLSSYDPALATLPPLLYATCTNLVSYPDKPMPQGARIVPEVAEAVPVPTEGGRTYTFRIRPGFRFSPPSNAAVTAATFKSTIERVIDPRMRSQSASQFSGLLGYRAYVEGKVHRLSGVVARGRTLTIRLSHPDGGFLANLASGAACAVPRETPAAPINDIPSAGPYYIASYTPRQQLVLERNPNYHGDRPRHFDRLVIAIGVNGSRALAEIEAGKADYALEGLPRDAGSSLETKYGAGSKAAKEGHQQYFISEALAARFLHMNASRPLFSHVRLRKAVNFAIDRAALVAAGRRFSEVNPFNAGKPTDELLPPAIEGATDPHLYPLNGPDLDRAKQLAGHVHATAIMYTPNVPPWLQEAQIVRRDLRPLGIDVQVKEFPIGDFYARIMRRGERFDLAVSGWWMANTDPAPVLGMFSGERAGSASNPNLSHFHDPGFDRELEAAARLSGTRRYRDYDRLAIELERDLAPAAPFATDASRDFFSARIGCQVYQPVYGMDLAALCLRR